MVAVDIGPADLELLTRFVLRLGGYAEGLFDFHNFGFDKSILSGHINSVRDELVLMREELASPTVNLRPPNLSEDAIWEEADETWNYGQSLRFAAGASMLTERYRGQITPENRKKAFIAKVLYECQAGILDDLVDKGRYTFIEAKDLYHHCFASMTDPGFDINTFRKELALILKQEQLSMFDLMTSITAGFNRLITASPNGQDLFYEMERVNERVILGQALTMFQKEANLDLTKLKRISSGFWAPDPDVAWHERISSYVSHATNHSLIDMAFRTDSIGEKEITALSQAWYYYDIVIVHLNNVVGLHKDLRAGLVNLALISMREKDVLNLTTAHGYNPNLTIADYERQFMRTTEFSRRAIERAVTGASDPDLFYPFITIMIPVVMMADWIGNRDDMIHRYLELVEPSVRQAAERVTPPLAEPPAARVSTQ